MQRTLNALTRLALRLLFKPFIGSRLPVPLQRRWLSLLTRSVLRAPGVEMQELGVGELRMLRLRPQPAAGAPGAPAAEPQAIFYVHGGGFTLGGGTTYAGFASWIAAVSGADVYLPDYRLAPEHPYPAPIDDLFAAYGTLLELGPAPARVAIMGDSAGGALAVSLTLVLAEMEVPAPAALVLISPFLDLSLSGPSVARNARRDPMISRGFAEVGGRAHAGALRRSDPRVSPLFADLAPLPPTLVQVGSDEILLDDAMRFADRAYAAGVDLELQRFEGQFHDFQTGAATLEAAREALEDVAAFLRRRLG